MFSNNNPAIFRNALEFKKDALYAMEDITISFPKKFVKLGLATISGNMSVIGVIAILYDGYYMSYKIPTMLQLSESTGINEVSYNDMPYVVIKYDKGMKIFDYNTVSDPGAIFTLFDSFLIRNNNIPAYLTYDDILRIFINGVNYAGSNLSESPIEVALILSNIAKGNKKFLRQVASKSDILAGKVDYEFKGLSDVTILNDVYSLVSGNYQSKGTARALAIGEDAKRIEIEQHLRK